MALDPSILSGQLEAALVTAKTSTSPTAQADLARAIANAIDAYIRTATVNTIITQATAVGGLCVAGGAVGPVPGGPAGAIVTGKAEGLPGVGIK